MERNKIKLQLFAETEAPVANGSEIPAQTISVDKYNEVIAELEKLKGVNNSLAKENKEHKEARRAMMSDEQRRAEEISEKDKELESLRAQIEQGKLESERLKADKMLIGTFEKIGFGTTDYDVNKDIDILLKRGSGEISPVAEALNRVLSNAIELVLQNSISQNDKEITKSIKNGGGNAEFDPSGFSRYKKSATDYNKRVEL